MRAYANGIDVTKGTNAIGRGTGPLPFGFAAAEGWDFFFGSCSWYCGSPAIKVASSSFLTERHDLKHSATQVHDGNMGKVWSEEVKGNGNGIGIGESLTFTFHTTKEDTTDLGVTSCAIGI